MGHTEIIQNPTNPMDFRIWERDGSLPLPPEKPPDKSSDKQLAAVSLVVPKSSDKPPAGSKLPKRGSSSSYK